MAHLDLTMFDSNTWDVTLPNGDVVNVKKPTQKMFVLLEQKIKKVSSETDTLKQLDKLIDLTELILSNNKGNIKIDKSVLESLTVDMLHAIYYGYMQFVHEIASNPN